MISQKCPKCLSKRVRRGYRPTPFWSKILFRYNLLCDNCNWEFTGFAVPGTVTAKPTKSPKKKTVLKSDELITAAGNENGLSDNTPETKSSVAGDAVAEMISNIGHEAGHRKRENGNQKGKVRKSGV